MPSVVPGGPPDFLITALADIPLVVTLHFTESVSMNGTESLAQTHWQNVTNGPEPTGLGGVKFRS